MIDCLEITVRTLENVLDKRSRRTWSAEAGRAILDYCPELWRSDPGLRCLVNGLLVDLYHDGELPARPGDELIFYRLPAGLETLALLGLGLLLTGVSFAVSALTAPSVKPLSSGKDDSPTYGFDAIFNTVRPGTPIPIVYGTHRVGGHIIQQFTRQTGRGEDPKAGELHTLLGLCAGPIEGVDSVRINGNPLSDYGDDVLWETRLGGNYQAPLTGFRDVTTAYPKDSVLDYAGGALVFTTGGAVDAWEVVLRFPGGLFKVSDRGQYKQKSVSIKMEYRAVGAAAWTWAQEVTVSEQTSNPFDFWLRGPRVARAQYEVRLTRLTPDDTQPTGSSQVNVLSVNDVTEEVLTYPRIALLAVRQLPSNKVSGNPPTYDSLVRGRRVRVYSSLTEYTVQWSDNPAWCFLDYLTDAWVGLGAWINDARIDLQSVLDWAAFCDELVPKDGAGELEKRYRLNLVLDGSLSVIDAIKQICTTGQAWFLQRGDKWAVRIDRAEEPVQLFTMGRTVQNSFQVAKFSRLETANYLVGEFYNEALDYEQDTLPKEDQTLGVDDEQRVKDISLLGTTTASQANRLLNYFVLSNRLVRRQINFEVGAEALALEAGDVFRVAHDVPGWGYSGKLRAVNSVGGTVTLDRLVTVEEDKSYELTVIHGATDAIDVVTVTSLPGTTNVLNVSGDWSTLPTAGTDYSFGEVTRSTVLYRAMAITQGPKPWRRRIRAREYNAAVYGTDLTVLPDPSVSRLPDPNRIPPDVRDLRLAERQVYAEDGSLSVAIDVHFTLPSIVGIRAEVYWRELGGGAWLVAGPPVSVGYASIASDVEAPGFTYEVSVVTLSPSGNRKPPDAGIRSTITTTGTTRRPDKVAGFLASRTLTGLILTWLPLDPVRNFDLAYYEVRQGPTWQTALVLGRTLETQLETSIVVKGVQTYLVKGVNTAGKDSAEPAVVVISVEGRIGENVVFERVEDPDWTGTRENWTKTGDILVLNTTGSVVAWRSQLQVAPLKSALGAGGYGVGFRVSGSYMTAPFEVASEALRCLVSTELELNQVDTTLYWDSADLAGKTWDSDFARSRQWSVAPEGRVTSRLEMRFSTTNSSEASFGPWAERPQNVEVLVRWAQVRVSVTVRDPAFTCQLVKLRLGFDVPDVTEGGSVDTSAVGTTAVTYGKAFNAIPKVTVTVLSATEGDQPIVTDETKTGFTIGVKNATAWVARTVDWHAIGY